MFLVGIGHKRQRGKTTLAEYIATNMYGRIADEFLIRHFADSLKEDALKEGWNGSKDEAGRKFLQDYGVKKRLFESQDYWIRRLVESVGGTDKIVLIPDVRFENEARWIKRSGGLLIRIDRNGIEHDRAIDLHSSEVDLDSFNEWNFVVDNNGSKEDLAWIASGLSRALIGRRESVKG